MCHLHETIVGITKSFCGSSVIVYRRHAENSEFRLVNTKSDSNMCLGVCGVISIQTMSAGEKIADLCVWLIAAAGTSFKGLQYPYKCPQSTREVR